MKFEGERIRKKNTRRGPGWWMDCDGTWRAPEEWPEEYPPLLGWVRDRNGGWRAPREVPHTQTRWTRLNDDDPEVQPEPERVDNRESPQAAADTRAMLTATGVLAAVALLVTGAMLLISQAGADPDEPSPPTTDVLFAADTDQALAERRREAAAGQPAIRRNDLAALPRRTPIPQNAPAFDHDDWVGAEDGCLSVAERVLIERSASEVTFVDQLDCVPDTGEWVGRDLGTTITRVIDADVVPLVPFQVAYESGGWAWSDETKQAYASDTDHPATLRVVASGFGHNPRNQDPSAWKPASRSQWCSYAVDWIAVKTHWQLSVTSQERSALAAMLDTCAEPTSAGADPATIVLTELEPPPITLAES